MSLQRLLENVDWIFNQFIIYGNNIEIIHDKSDGNMLKKTISQSAVMQCVPWVVKLPSAMGKKQ